jgi:hypothetical protein
MLHVNLLVAVADRQRLRGPDCLLQFLGETVEVHTSLILMKRDRRK